MKSVVNQVIVKIKDEYEDTISYGNLVLDRYKGSDTLVDEEGLITYNKLNQVRIHGEVVSVPGTLKNEYLCERYTGTPKSQSVDVMYISDVPIEVQVGDYVYFHYLSISPENYLKSEDGYNFYMVRYDNIFCVKRLGKLIPVSGYVFLKPVKNEVEEVAGLVLSAYEKDNHFEGIITHVGNSRVGYESPTSLSEGVRVILMPNSTFINLIDGVEYIVCQQWDILAKRIGGYVVPMGCMIEVEEDSIEDITPGGIILYHVTAKRNSNTRIGTIKSVGDLCEGFAVGDRVVYLKTTFRKYQDDNIKLIHKEDILCKIMKTGAI